MSAGMLATLGAWMQLCWTRRLATGLDQASEQLFDIASAGGSGAGDWIRLDSARRARRVLLGLRGLIDAAVDALGKDINALEKREEK